MKREMDLIREILRTVEERPEKAKHDVSIPGRSDEEMRLHLHLMKDAGLIDGLTIGAQFVAVGRLTNAGYDFLDASRKDTIWQKAKDMAISKTGGLSIAALTEALKVVVKAAITGTA